MKSGWLIDRTWVNLGKNSEYSVKIQWLRSCTVIRSEMSVIPEQKYNFTLYTFLNKEFFFFSREFWNFTNFYGIKILRRAILQHHQRIVCSIMHSSCGLWAQLIIHQCVLVPFLNKYMKHTSDKLNLVWFCWFVFLLPALIALHFSIMNFFIVV